MPDVDLALRKWNSKPDPKAYPLARNEPNRIVIPVEHVLVLVGGTVDPTNLYEDTGGKSSPSTHSRGYSVPGERAGDPSYWSKAASELRDAHDPNWYWEDNENLRKAVVALSKRHARLHLFTLHGWSGDNSQEPREIAGRHLCDRLCGGGGEKAYYANWLKRPVYFHLLGHSHGGNVINEFTRSAAESPAWPAKWKIRTITYLSTPFFRRLHPVNTAKFHPDCAILNVVNNFDLTQRVAADFNLNQLNGALVLADVGSLKAIIGQLKFDPNWFWDALKDVALVDQDPAPFSYDPALLMEPASGRRLYEGSLSVLEKIDQLLQLALKLIERLHRGVVFPVALQFVKKVCAGRVVISDPLAQRFRFELMRLQEGLRPTLAAFRARLARGVFPVSGLVADLHVNVFFEPLVRLIAIDAHTLEGPLWRLVHDLLVEQLEEFDDTVTSPEALLAGTPFASNIVQLDITNRDTYRTEDAAKRYVRNFPTFMRSLESSESAYAATRDYRSLVDILFTLLAQLEPMREWTAKYESDSAELSDYLPWLERLGSWSQQPEFGRFVRLLIELLHSLAAYLEIVRARAAWLEVPVAELPPEEPGDPPFGSLSYFLHKSHSRSRRDLYPEVLDAWEDHLSPTKRS